MAYRDANPRKYSATRIDYYTIEQARAANLLALPRMTFYRVENKGIDPTFSVVAGYEDPTWAYIIVQPSHLLLHHKLIPLKEFFDNLNKSVGDDPNAPMGYLVKHNERIQYDSLSLDDDDDVPSVAVHVNGYHTVTRAVRLILKTCLFQSDDP